MKRLMIALALALAPATALAQETHGDNAEVVSAAAAPSNISLTFEHAVILTQVQVHGPGHTPIPVSHTAPTSPQAAYVIALPALASGAYEVHWNATGDGHAMEGALHFTVQ
ncbi:MAG TPA: copper resistance protein CopC [Terricaulis sp.]|nr:copper resistance protein CopC [Terricaulis sp.]